MILPESHFYRRRNPNENSFSTGGSFGNEGTEPASAVQTIFYYTMLSDAVQYDIFVEKFS